MADQGDLSGEFDENNDVNVEPYEPMADKVTYRVFVPKPDKERVYRESIQNSAVTNKHGGIWDSLKDSITEGKRRTIRVQHEDSGAIVGAQKTNRSAPWKIRLHQKDGAGNRVVSDAQYVPLTDKEAVKIGDKELLKKIVDKLSNDLVGVQDYLKKAVNHELNEKELLDAEAGDPRREGGARPITFNKNVDKVIAKVEQGAGMLVTVETEMPPEFDVKVEKLMNPRRATIDDDYVRIGSTTHGYIAASRRNDDENDIWVAMDEDSSYIRYFDANMQGKDVALEVAQDIAADALSKKDYEEHIRDRELVVSEIASVFVNGETFVRDEGNNFVTEAELEQRQQELDADELEHS
ncbi:MAG: hypothetical protein ACRBDL_11280 [Alphaproteobacteria bacterium]